MERFKKRRRKERVTKPQRNPRFPKTFVGGGGAHPTEQKKVGSGVNQGRGTGTGFPERGGLHQKKHEVSMWTEKPASEHRAGRNEVLRPREWVARQKGGKGEQKSPETDWGVKKTQHLQTQIRGRKGRNPNTQKSQSLGGEEPPPEKGKKRSKDKKTGPG